MNQFRTGASRLSSALVLSIALSMSIVFVGCSGEGEPVAELIVEPSNLQLGYGRFIDLDFTWIPKAELGSAAGPVMVFVHLLGDEGRVIRTFDHQLPETWNVGKENAYSVRLYQSLLAPALAPGEYTLSAGLYDQAGQRWPLATGSEAVAKMEYQVATVSVPDQGADAPRLGFSESWQPARPGNDRQIVATRRLSRDGAIRLDRIEGPGTLWVDVIVPRATLEAPRVFREGVSSEATELRVHLGCSGFESTMSGEGHFSFGIEVTPPEPSAEPCDLVLETNSYLELATDPGETDPLLLTLNQLAWRPAA